ncbi:hypothetical protein FGADI_3943 [Fusarium gaditjirri]|uniref:Ankyrin repeat protein n=1 Tax=Fusarium gaditjirri TaxID=282569 RepID=A0A8H4TEL5_9HYPO|nr:hypothetical protein FGADI_3943 [Fusarium gaditjirri]
MSTDNEAKPDQSMDGGPVGRIEISPAPTDPPDKPIDDSTADVVDTPTEDDRLQIFKTVKNMANNPESDQHQGLAKLREFIRPDYAYKTNVNATDDSEETALHVAAKYGLLDVAELLITEFEANVAAQNNEKRQPLHMACLNGHRRVVELLLNNKSDIEARQCHDATPLDEACWKGHVDVVELLLSRDAQVMVEDENGWTPLISASYYGNSKIVRLLLDKDDANVNNQDRKDKRTALHAAISTQHLDVVAELTSPLTCKTRDAIHLDVRDINGRTPLVVACIDGFTKGVELLIKAGADYNICTTLFANTPLIIASGWGYKDIVNQLLVTTGIKLNEKDKQGFTALHVACLGQFPDIVQLLIEAPGIELDAVDKIKQTPLHLAVEKGDERIVKLLAGKMSEVDQRDKNGQTALHLAVSSGHENHTKVLLDKGADLSIRDTKNRTALHLASSVDEVSSPDASERGFDQDFGAVIRLLLSKGARLEETTEDGKTATDLLMASKRPEMFQSLLDHACQSFREKQEGQKDTGAEDWNIVKLCKRDEMISRLSDLLSQSQSGYWRIQRETLDLALGVVLSLVKDLDLQDDVLCDRLPAILWLLLASSDRSQKTQESLEEALRYMDSLSSQAEMKTSRRQVLPDKYPEESQDTQKERNTKMQGNRSEIRGEPTKESQPDPKGYLDNIQDILRDPPYAQIHIDNPDLFKDPKLANEDHKSLVEQFEATIVQFYTEKDRSGTLRRYRRLKDVIYGEGPATIMNRATEGIKLKKHAMGFEGSPNFTWVHLPATNMNWMNDLALKIIKQEGYSHQQYYELRSFFKDSWIQVPDEEIESRSMKPRAVVRREESEAREHPGKTLSRTKSLPMPTTKTETDEKHSDNKKETQPKISASALYMPYFCFSTHCPQDTNKAKLLEDYSKLLKGYGGSVLHGSPTIDEWYYHFANDHESQKDKADRNKAQVVTKFLTEMAEIANSSSEATVSAVASTNGHPNGSEDTESKQITILRVNQIWIWTISDKWIISSSSCSLDDDHIGLVDGILDQLIKQAKYGGSDSQPKSAEDMSKIIVNYCIDAYDRKPKGLGSKAGTSIAQIFSDYMNMIGRHETTLSSKLSGWTSGNEAKTRVEETRKNIRKAQDLYLLIKDVRDELNILRSASRFQKIVQRSLSVNLGREVQDEELSAGYVENDIAEMDAIADRIQSALNTAISLQQNEIANHQAEVANKQAEYSVDLTEDANAQTKLATEQGKVLMVFTFATLLFLPLSFLSSLFALDAESFLQTPEWVFIVIFVVSITVSLFIGLLALRTYDWFSTVVDNLSRSLKGKQKGSGADSV